MAADTGSIGSVAASGGIRAVLDALAASPGPVVLAIVVAASGSTYRKRGALVAFGSDGRRHGWLSGGCLEGDLEHAAAAAAANGAAAHVVFNTRSDDDLVFGTASGCRGVLDVVMLPLGVDAPLRRALDALRHARRPLALALAADGGGEARLDDASWTWRSTPSGAVDARWHVEIAPPPRALLLGAGPETSTLLGFLRALGWTIDVVEHRGRWTAHAGTADRLFAVGADGAAAATAVAHYDAAIVMSHHYANDLAHLRHLATRDIGYVGLLGPPARRDALLADLGDAAATLAPRLHAPVGLRLGGEGPEAIALAIAADLHRHCAGLRA